MSTAAKNSLKQNPIFHIILLTASVLISYFGVWNAYFVSDDDFSILGWVKKQPSFLDAIQGYGRGVQYLNYGILWIQTSLFDMTASYYYLTGLFYFTVVTILIYFLVNFWSNRRSTAFVAALLFATTFSHFTVITTVSATLYSFRAILYLSALGLFGLHLHLRRRSPLIYGASVLIYLILAFTWDYALSFPLVLLAYHLTLGMERFDFRQINWQNLKLHLPFWGIFAIHLALQISYIFLSETSKAASADAVFQPGFHMISNYFYLIFMLIPNISIPAIANFLAPTIGSTGMTLVWQIFIVISIIGHFIALLCLWKGSSLVRFSLALIYFPYLQYSLWVGGFAGAPRYLYLSSIGYCILLAIGTMWLYDYLANHITLSRYRVLVPIGVLIFMLANIFVIQIWLQQQVENGKVRRAFIEQFLEEFQDVDSNTLFVVEVKQDKFLDLKTFCLLAVSQAARCDAHLEGERTVNDVVEKSSGHPVYWLKLTNNGFDQLYPGELTGTP
jgi:hypothetical protein